jgi:hypothetical protein
MGKHIRNICGTALKKLGFIDYLIHRKAARFVKNGYERTEYVTRLLDELGWDR